MFKRAGIPLASHSSIFSSNAWDQGVFVDCGAPKHIKHMNIHAHPDKRWKAQVRGFAEVRSDSGSNGHFGGLPWPELTSATDVPTPYQIFHLEKNGIYSKRRFYELVKVYHPDRNLSEQNKSEINSLSSDVRIERYRLVVAANDILSDPAKRSAYDRYGLGWEKHTEAASPKYSPAYRHRYRTRWAGFDTDDSPMRNATWEDWERWNHRQNRGKQDPMYFANGALLSMIVVIASLVASLQIKQVGDVSFASLGQVEAMTRECHKNIQSRRSTSRELKNPNDRLQRFLESRAPHGSGMLEPEDDVPKRLPLPPES